MPLFVVGNLFRKLRNEVGPLRTRSDKVHLTAKNIPELRYLIDAKFTNYASHSRGAIVVRTSPYRAGFFRIHSHRAKLHYHESAAVFSYALLLVKNGSA